MVASNVPTASVVVDNAVSIPFIAGQWSLLYFCRCCRSSHHVSIPFIAGQWSLLKACGVNLFLSIMFQSPSLRGSGRFARPVSKSQRASQNVSIPFIAGQWSLRTSARPVSKSQRAFQSPSLRGSGRFGVRVSTSSKTNKFQSPSLRGSGRFVGRLPPPRGASLVSIPFIAGQWSLEERARKEIEAREGFNPLHCGAVVASPRTTPLSFCRVLLRNTRPACDHVLCARLHVWPKPVIIP